MGNEARRQGFTIVELLIVLVVIAILASITIVSYQGIQQRARNTAIISDVVKMKKLIQVYSVLNGAQSFKSLVTANAFYCIGESYLDMDPGVDTSCYLTREDPPPYEGYTPISVPLNNSLKQYGNYSISKLPPVKSSGQYADGTMWSQESSGPELFVFGANRMLDGAPAFAYIRYRLDGHDQPCGAGPTFKFVSNVNGVINYTTAPDDGYNDGEGDKATVCSAYISAP